MFEVDTGEVIQPQSEANVHAHDDLCFEAREMLWSVDYWADDPRKERHAETPLAHNKIGASHE